MVGKVKLSEDKEVGTCVRYLEVLSGTWRHIGDPLSTSFQPPNYKALKDFLVYGLNPRLPSCLLGKGTHSWCLSLRIKLSDPLQRGLTLWGDCVPLKPWSGKYIKHQFLPLPHSQKGRLKVRKSGIAKFEKNSFCHSMCQSTSKRNIQHSMFTSSSLLSLDFPFQGISRYWELMKSSR
jgi:hypothetical protein